MAVNDQAAIVLLKRAVDLDAKRRRTEALLCYKEGLQLLMNVLKNEKDETKLSAYRSRANDYMNRAEELNRAIEADKKSGKFHEQIRISAGSSGHSYDSLFGRFLTNDVTKVAVDDPYIRINHQVRNFLRLCELVLKRCNSLKTIHLLTSKDTKNPSEQSSKLKELAEDVSSRGVRLTIDYSDTLHDREIRLDTGWTIKIGRGLDIYMPAYGKMSIGLFDTDLRKCHETTVDIFHKSTVAKTTSGGH